MACRAEAAPAASRTSSVRTTQTPSILLQPAHTCQRRSAQICFLSLRQSFGGSGGRGGGGFPLWADRRVPSLGSLGHTHTHTHTHTDTHTHPHTPTHAPAEPQARSRASRRSLPSINPRIRCSACVLRGGGGLKGVFRQECNQGVLRSVFRCVQGCVQGVFRGVLGVCVQGGCRGV